MGTIVGAGILGIPYVVSKSGFPIGVFHIVLIGILMAVTMLYLGEIVQRTKKNHQLPGYAEKYLGKKGKIWMFIALAFGIYSAILAYLIAEGRSLSLLIFHTPVYELQMGIAFWVVLSAITYFGIKALEEGEMVGVVLVFVTIVAISVFFANKIDWNNLSYIFPSNLFVPFGVILFAFLGFAAIPEIERILGRDRKPMRKIIITSYTLVALIYIAFAAIVIGFAGDKIPEVATIALGTPFIALGMLTMFTAYLSLNVAMIDTFRFDFGKTRNKAWLYTITIPLVAFVILSLVGKAGFTSILGIGGVLSGGLTAILILAMVKNAKSRGNAKPSYSMPYSKLLFYIFAAIFILGALLEINNILF
jgi:tyrosine-specific transport protein